MRILPLFAAFASLALLPVTNAAILSEQDNTQISELFAEADALNVCAQRVAENVTAHTTTGFSLSCTTRCLTSTFVDAGVLTQRPEVCTTTFGDPVARALSPFGSPVADPWRPSTDVALGVTYAPIGDGTGPVSWDFMWV